MTSVDQNRELFARSGHAANFRYNLPDAMTYHHVIPRNKLATFWNSVQQNGELAYLSPAIDTLIKDAIERVHGDPDLVNSAVLEVQGNEQSKGDLMAVMEKMGEGTQLNNAETEGGEIIEKIYQWWPANIHHGPTARPVGIDPERDDGGNAFEVSAKHVMPKNQFGMLAKLDALMDKYQTEATAKTRKLQLKNIKGLIVQLSSVKSITAFDQRRWQQVPSGQLQNQWRIIPKKK